MELFKVSVTPEQQAAMQDRLAEVWEPFNTAMRAAAPVMAHAAREAATALRSAASPPVTPPQ